MNKEYYPLNHDYYHNPHGARRPIPHEHDMNDKVRVDCFDRLPGFLENKISACNGVAIVKEIDEYFNARLILSSTRGEEPGYEAGNGIDSDKFKNLIIEVSGFENYYTKDEVSSNFASHNSYDKIDYDLSLLYHSAKNYYDTSYNIIKSHSANWDKVAEEVYVPGQSLKEAISANGLRIGALESQSATLYDGYYTLNNNSGKWNEFDTFTKDYYKAMDSITHQLQQFYKLLNEISGKLPKNEEGNNG